jgi:hypothetical protein
MKDKKKDAYGKAMSKGSTKAVASKKSTGKRYGK